MYTQASTQTDIQVERSRDASHDVTSPSDMNYDVGRVLANRRHCTVSETREIERERERERFTVKYFTSYL